MEKNKIGEILTNAEKLSNFVEDYRDYVIEFLTDYNDNFIGIPCTEIVDEVLDTLLSKLQELGEDYKDVVDLYDTTSDMISDIASELFD